MTATATDPIADLRLTLLENGYSPIPAVGKKTYVDGWSTIRADAAAIDAWTHQYPDHINTGLLTGALVGIDIDAPDSETAESLIELALALPGAMSAPYRVGKAPKCLYIFRATEARDKRATGKFRIGENVCEVEIMGIGQQIIAFGTHPDTDRPYEWFNGSPLDTPFAELPEISTETIDAFLVDATEALTARGTPISKARTKPAAANDNRLPVAISGTGSWADIKTRAFADLDAWVPQLGLPRLKRYNQGFLAVASFRPSRRAGLADHKRGHALEISPQGICDHSDDNRGYSPIDLVMACHGMAAPDAADWLRDRVGGGEYRDDGTKPANVGGLISKKAAPAAANDNQRSRFQVTWFDDIGDSKPKHSLIKGMLGEREFTMISGLPGSGKSVITTDAACHVASGKEWHGRKVKQGLVIYVAAERKALTERRMLAFRLHHKVKDVPLLVVGGTIDLTTGLTDADALATVTNEAAKACGEPCVWIIIDTLTRTFGPGDQHQSKDMAKFVRSCDRLAEKTGAHVTVIHHTTWTGERGKGAIDLDGAVDASFIVKKRRDSFSLICDGTNDGEEGAVCCFTMQGVEVGLDDDGEPTIAPVVVSSDGVTAGARLNFKGYTAKGLEILTDACRATGSPVNKEDWRTAFYAAYPGDKPETLKVRFQRLREALEDSGAVQHDADTYWVAQGGTDGTSSADVPCSDDHLESTQAERNGTPPLGGSGVPSDVPVKEDVPSYFGDNDNPAVAEGVAA